MVFCCSCLHGTDSPAEKTLLDKADEVEDEVEREDEPYMPIVDCRHSGRIAFDDVELDEQIATGASGIVYSGRWDDHAVAIKSLFSSVVEGIDMPKFDAQAQLVARLIHPNVSRLFGVTVNGSEVFLVMERCICSLKDVLGYQMQLRTPQTTQKAASRFSFKRAKQHPFELSTRLKILRDVAMGMAYVHGRKIIHRDLQPANILFGSNSRDRRRSSSSGDITCSTSNTFTPSAADIVKVSDFQLARQLTSDSHMTACGSPAYMAPEILASGRGTYGSAVDVFSFALILWEMQHLCKPYGELPSYEVPSLVIDGTRPPISPDCPPAIKALITKCWKGDPEERPTFQEIADETLSIAASAGT
jgi:serine/threonine protein kinase